MSKTIRLAVYFDDELRATRELSVPFVIGRSRDVNLTISHPMVSRRHCLIYEEKGTFRLQDLGSLNGTYLGKDRVTELVLEDGSEFLIGNIRFVFNPADTVQSSVFLVSPDSDIVQADVMPEDSFDLPPPLPPLPQLGEKPVEAESPTNIPPLKETCPPVVSISSTGPSFIKPLPSIPSMDARNRIVENDMVDLNNVIDLANVTDKEASTPPAHRESK